MYKLADQNVQAVLHGASWCFMVLYACAKCIESKRQGQIQYDSSGITRDHTYTTNNPSLHTARIGFHPRPIKISNVSERFELVAFWNDRESIAKRRTCSKTVQKQSTRTAIWRNTLLVEKVDIQRNTLKQREHEIAGLHPVTRLLGACSIARDWTARGPRASLLLFKDINLKYIQQGVSDDLSSCKCSQQITRVLSARWWRLLRMWEWWIKAQTEWTG